MLSTVTDKGQVTLPKPIRDQLGIRAGTRIDFEVHADGSLRARVLTRGSAGLFGLVARPGEAARSLEEIDAGVTEAVVERSRRKR
jgi:antitoxin PrlF